MAKSFENIWRLVMLHCPLASPFLVRTWVQDAYNKLCDSKRWSHLRAEAEFLLNASKAGTVTVVRGSATVVGVSITFASTDAGRQFKINQGPPYSIESVDTGTNTIVLDRVYGDTSATATGCTVLDAYLTCPEDFGSFIAVIDPSNAWQLHLWVTENELNRWDAARVSSGTPWAVVNRRIATTTANLDRIQYELWPYTQSAKRYPYYYIRRPEELSDSDTFTGPLRNRTDIIMKAALGEAASWPGNGEVKNPYFNLQLAMKIEKEVVGMIEDLACRDEDVYLTWIDYSGINRIPYAPIDSKFMQNHEFSNLQASARF